jgi:hypothetical protein
VFKVFFYKLRESRTCQKMIKGTKAFEKHNKRESITYDITLLAGLPLGVLQALLVTADGNEASLLLERVADGAGADLSVLQVATKRE